jgi:hypothetical protein
MKVKFNWSRMQELVNSLRQKGLTDDSLIVLHFIVKNSPPRKRVLQLKDLLLTFWRLDGQNIPQLKCLAIQDNRGNTLYRYKMLNQGDEEIPNGGNTRVIANWNNLNKSQKETYLKLLISQFNAHES